MENHDNIEKITSPKNQKPKENLKRGEQNKRYREKTNPSTQQKKIRNKI